MMANQTVAAGGEWALVLHRRDPDPLFSAADQRARAPMSLRAAQDTGRSGR